MYPQQRGGIETQQSVGPIYKIRPKSSNLAQRKQENPIKEEQFLSKTIDIRNSKGELQQAQSN